MTSEQTSTRTTPLPVTCVTHPNGGPMYINTDDYRKNPKKWKLYKKEHETTKVDPKGTEYPDDAPNNGPVDTEENTGNGQGPDATELNPKKETGKKGGGKKGGKGK